MLAASALALFFPGLFTWFNGDKIIWGLAIVMLGMGITLSFDDFRNVLKMPGVIAVGFVGHYLIMPFLGWGIAKLLLLPTPYAVGLIIVSCCPSGTASNVVNYIGRNNVPLAVLITMCSTFGAIVMTPLLTKFLAGTYVPVNAWALFLSTLQVILIPLILGLLLHQFVPRMVKAVMPVAPLVAVITVALICASIIGQNSENIRTSGGILLFAVFLLHSVGFALGYLLARILGYQEIIRRTISIEVGMQNSALGVALANRHFPQMPLAPVPCAISAIFHSVIGSVLAGFWRLNPPQRRGPQPPGRRIHRTTSTHDEQIGFS